MVALVLENELLRQRMDANHHSEGYAPEVLRLWMSRVFESYQEATLLLGQVHSLWKVRQGQGQGWGGGRTVWHVPQWEYGALRAMHGD